ncbi:MULTISPECIES: hypothetical protein [Nonlabens]|uniref:hypothetical protein n=1 Tax=Nonlabens TaxID=363408 RepID=UPI003264DD20
MNRISTKYFSAVINIGLEYGYEQKPIQENEIISFIQKYQDNLILNRNIHLSCSISKCIIVLSGQIEPHLKIGFINYPKFELEHSVLKKEIEKLTTSLMNKFIQNRIVIEFNDEIVMLEKNNMIDNRVKKPTGNRADGSARN